MNLIDPDSGEWSEFMRQAFMAQFAVIPQPLRLDDELIPGRDGLEGEDE